MESKNTLFLESERITNYLIGIPIHETEKNTYAAAMQKVTISFSKYEQLLWQNMLKSKWRMACIDAGLAVKEPNNSVRRKLFTMLAILEASPNYTSFFLSKRFSFFYLFKIGIVAMHAFIKLLIGLIIINTIKRKCN